MNFYEINKGLGMLWGQSYVMPMMSCDIIGMTSGGLGLKGGGGSWKVDQFGNLKNPSDFNTNKLHTQCMCIPT